MADLDPLRLSQLKPQYVDTFGRFLERCSQDEDAAPAPSSSSPSSTVFDLSGFGLAGVDQVHSACYAKHPCFLVG